MWLIKGDFDHTKAFNDVYGREIVDHLLDWAIDIVLELFSDFQTEHRLGGVDMTVAGDDITLSFPLCSLTKKHIEGLLCRIRDALRQYFRNRFVVACVNNIDQTLENLPWTDVRRFRKGLEDHGILLDLVARKRGYLVLTRLLSSKESPEKVLKRIVRTINRTFPVRPEKEISAGFNWLFCPETGTFESFNKGIVWPMNISFGAVSNRVTLKEFGFPRSQQLLSERQSEAVFERMSLLCQCNVKLAKAKDHSISVNAEVPEELLCARNNLHIVIPAIDFYKARMPLASERYLRQVVSQNMSEDHNGLIMKLEPVYCVESTTRQSHEPECRGNSFGIGLKGINSLCGDAIGSQVIIRLIFSVSDIIREFCFSKGLAENMIHLAMFVDTFTIYFRRIILTRHEIVQLAGSILKSFNTNIKGLKISHLTLSVVWNKKEIRGDSLLHQLDNISIAENSTSIIHKSNKLLVKEYCPGVKYEGNMKMKVLAYQSACSLANTLSGPAENDTLY